VEAAQYSLLTLIGVGTALLLLGLTAGLLAGRRSSTAGQRLRETEQRTESRQIVDRVVFPSFCFPGFCCY